MITQTWLIYYALPYSLGSLEFVGHLGILHLLFHFFFLLQYDNNYSARRFRRLHKTWLLFK